MPIFITTVNATAGTAEQASTSQDEYRYILFMARPSNGSAVYVGSSSAVTSTNGVELAPGADFTISLPRGGDFMAIADFWFDAATGTDNIDVFAQNS